MINGRIQKGGRFFFNDDNYCWNAKFSSVLESSKSGWKTFENLKGSHPQGIAFDRLNQAEYIVGRLERVYRKTDDSGQTWDSIER